MDFSSRQARSADPATRLRSPSVPRSSLPSDGRPPLGGTTTPAGGSSVEALMPVVYDELRRLASRYLRMERRDHTLQPTALVNEAYIRIARAHDLSFADRIVFCRVAARSMRRILVNHARDRARLKRRPPGEREPIEPDEVPTNDLGFDFVALDAALLRLERRDSRKAEVVQLRYFGGMTLEETATTLGLSLAQVKRDWALAKAWLHRELRGLGGEPG